MAGLDEKISAMAEQMMKRPLTGEEQLEIFRISEAAGMRDVQSFLYLLLVFKLNEDTMRTQFEKLVSFEGRLSEKFDEIGALSARINETLSGSIERILGEGAKRIGGAMGDEIASRSSEVMSSVNEFHTIRGYIVAASVTGISSTLAYWFGLSGVLRMDEINGPFRGVLALPAGWWMFFCCAAYTYFWCFDNWKKVKRSVFYKWLLALQGVIMAVLLISML
jgi:hypothetical protein